MTHFCWYPTVTIISYSILLLFFIIIIITIIKLISHAPGFRTSPIYCFPLWKLCPCAPFPYYLVISSNLTLMTEQTYVSVCLVFLPLQQERKNKMLRKEMEMLWNKVCLQGSLESTVLQTTMQRTSLSSGLQSYFLKSLLPLTPHSNPFFAKQPKWYFFK